MTRDEFGEYVFEEFEKFLKEKEKNVDSFKFEGIDKDFLISTLKMFYVEGVGCGTKLVRDELEKQKT